MDLKKVKRLIYGLLIAAFIIMACVYTWKIEWLLYGFTVSIGACGICVLLFWRCPFCGKHLGRVGNVKYCMHCGIDLYSE